jgi:RNA polymerase sigma factor (sigma-70 family)
MEGPADPALIERLLDDHLAALELYAAQWINAPEDCVQEAFVELARRSTVPERIVPWLYRVVRNHAISMARSAGRRRRHEQAAAAAAQTWFVPSRTGEIDAAAATEALRELPMRHREVIVARIWGGLTLAEVAQVVGVSVSTAHRRFEAGMKTLRKRLGLKWMTNKNRKNDCPTS